VNGSRQKERGTIQRLLAFWSEEHSLTALLVLLLFEMFIIVPITEGSQALAVIGAFIFSLLLLAGLFAMAGSRIFQIVSAVFVLCAIAVRLCRVVLGVSGILQWDALFSILSVVGMVVVVLWQVYREGPVTGHRIRGAIAAYLLIAITFAYIYTLLDYLVPGSFQLPGWASQPQYERVETFEYFSMVALTTTGFGDIAAVHPLARSLVSLEALIGQIYPAILIARLVTLQLEARHSGKKTRGDPS
jgi:hypothetical protein